MKVTLIALILAGTAAATELQVELTASEMAEKARLMALREKFVAEKDFCWRGSYGRGVGKIPQKCMPNEDRIGLLCYPKCHLYDYTTPQGNQRHFFQGGALTATKTAPVVSATKVSTAVRPSTAAALDALLAPAALAARGVDAQGAPTAPRRGAAATKKDMDFCAIPSAELATRILGAASAVRASHAATTASTISLISRAPNLSRSVPCALDSANLAMR